MAAFSTNDLLIRNSRISFAKIAPDVSSREERFIIANDNEGYKLHFGPSSLISTVHGDTLEGIFPGEAAFTFDLRSKNFGIGVSSPRYAIDISSNTGIRIQGGSFTGDAKGLISVPTAALFSTLPTAIFGLQTIPVSALNSTNNATLFGISVPTSSLFGYLDTSLYGISTIPLSALQGSGLIQASYFRGDGSQLSNIPLGAIDANITVGFFKPNSIPAYALPSTGNIWIRDVSGVIAAPYISTGTLTATYISSVSLISTANINTGAIITSSLTLTGKFDVAGISTGLLGAGSATILGAVRAGSFIGNGSQLTGINPANLLTTIPSNKFGYQTISFDSLNPYGDLSILGGTVSVDGAVNVTGTTTSGFFAGDGSKLTNLPFGSPLASTVAGLGTIGYVSSSSTSSSTSLYTDAWIQSNLINPPPPIIFGTPVSDSSQIFIPWTYPTQINVGFQQSWVPVINSLTVMVSTNLTNINPSTIISSLSTGIVNYHKTQPYITGVVIANSLEETGIQLKRFPQDNLSRYAFVYYDPSLLNLTLNGQLIAWYNNYNIGCNIASTIFSPFLLSGNPSIPTRLQSTNVTSNTMSLYFSTPEIVDILNPTSILKISQYNLLLNSVPIPGIRYGTALNDSQTTIINSPFTFVTSPDNSSGNVIRYNASNLFPDSKYNFFVNAVNTAQKTGLNASILGISTSYLNPTHNGISVNFPPRYFGGTIKRISDNLVVTTLINNTSSDWASSNFVVPIHLVSNRGTTDFSIGSLNVYMTIGTSPSINGSIVGFDGFPAETPIGILPQNNLGLTVINVYDAYATSLNQYKGFYLNSSNNVTIYRGFFSSRTVTGDQYTFTTSLAQNETVNTSQTSFFYDGEYSTAAILDMSFNFSVGTPPTYRYVSGVAVIYEQPRLSVVTGASNLGEFFYRSPILSYTTTAGSSITNFSETDLFNVVSGRTGEQFILNQRIGFSNSSFQLNSLNSAFATSMTMTVTAANASNTSAPFSASSIQCIIDGPSVTLLNTLPTSLLVLTNGVPSLGSRIWSGLGSFLNNATVFVAPYVFSSNSINYSYTAFLYTTLWHSYSIIDSNIEYPLINELQVTNGNHRSLGPFGGINSYLNYTSKQYSATDLNTVNYTTILTSSHRFATFAWKIGTQIVNYTNLTLTITYDTASTDQISLSNTLLIFTGTSDTLKVFYRIEDQDSITPTDGTSATTVWLDANGTIANKASALTYYVDNTQTYQQVWGGTTSGASLAAPTVRFTNLFIPSFATPSPKDIRLICRIGIPMNRNFAFSRVNATIS